MRNGKISLGDFGNMGRGDSSVNAANGVDPYSITQDIVTLPFGSPFMTGTTSRANASTQEIDEDVQADQSSVLEQISRALVGGLLAEGGAEGVETNKFMRESLVPGDEGSLLNDRTRGIDPSMPLL